MLKFTLNLSPKEADMLDRFQEPLNVTTRVGVIRRALDLLEVYLEAKRAGHHLVVEDDKGTQRLRLI